MTNIYQKFLQKCVKQMQQQEQITQCENVIIQQGELNGLEDYEIDKALEFFDRGVRKGLDPQESMLDIVDMMLDPLLEETES